MHDDSHIQQLYALNLAADTQYTYKKTRDLISRYTLDYIYGLSILQKQIFAVLALYSS